MAQKFVVRLLDAAGDLLGWAEVFVAPLSGGVFRIESTKSLTVDRAGVASSYSIHWADLDVARSVRITPQAVLGGASVSLRGLELWHVPNDAATPRPPVTVHASVVLSPEPGHIGAQRG